MLLLIRPTAGAAGDPPAAGNSISQIVSGVDPGTVLRLRADIWNATYGDARASLYWLDADGDVVGASSALQATLASVWQSHEGFYTAPRETAKAQVVLSHRQSTPTTEIRFDNVSLSVYSRQKTLMSGPLLNKRIQRGSAARRQTSIEVVGWNWYLDHREVQEFTGTSPKQLITDWGGPVQLTPAYSTSGAAWSGTATRSSVRGVIEEMNAPGSVGWQENYPYYVDNERQFHQWDADGITAFRDARHVGTAPSIGDQGEFIPEYLTCDEGSEQHLNYLYPYADGTAVLWPMRGRWGIGGTSYQQNWEAGDTFGSLDTIYSGAAITTNVQVDDYLKNFAGVVTAISFTTIEYDDWRPHQQIVIDDSVLTGGAATTAYIENVSGTIDERNVIEWRIDIGSPNRSLVQTVTQK